ncbi:MAG: hypothetical protein RJA98_3623 [Pseudomonadota bacterium]|jgi:uncharacterized protein (DUF2132 family)
MMQVMDTPSLPPAPSTPSAADPTPAAAAPAAPTQPKDPLHGVTLEAMVTALVEFFGWAELGQRIHIRCFVLDPSVASSLKFLRKTPWAREKVEGLYLYTLREQSRRQR